jgi:uncharacterized protein YqjF (DUF2071 family)
MANVLPQKVDSKYLTSIEHTPPSVNGHRFLDRFIHSRLATMTDRPVLTARWSELLLLNFPVPTELIARYAPPGTEPDLYDGQAYVSVVGFHFHHARLFGVSIPGHTRFTEINLRFYVRRAVTGELRRGVVFVKEIVPRRSVSFTANWLYHESYITRSMRSEMRVGGKELAAGDTIGYAWQSGRSHLLRGALSAVRRGPSGRARTQTRWNRLSACLTAAPSIPSPGSFEEFIIEHYWGYVRGRDGRTREYRVLHEPWRAAPVGQIVWDCDPAATYQSPWTDYLSAQPSSAFLADGSTVQLFRGRRLST